MVQSAPTEQHDQVDRGKPAPCRNTRSLEVVIVVVVEVVVVVVVEVVSVVVVEVVVVVVVLQLGFDARLAQVVASCPTARENQQNL